MSYRVGGVSSQGPLHSVALTQSAPVVEIVGIFLIYIFTALTWKIFACVKRLTVLAETWLKTLKGLVATRFVCFLRKVGMGGEGSLCKYVSRITLPDWCNVVK